jgi:hypothetical protein
MPDPNWPERWTPEQLKEMRAKLESGDLTVPRTHDDLFDAWGYAARARARDAAKAEQRLAMRALEALHGPPPENVKKRAWRAAEASLRLQPLAARPKTLRILTEDGELLWERPGPYELVFAELDERSRARAVGRYRCLTCGHVEEDPILGTFGPPTCPVDAGAMVRV